MPTPHDGPAACGWYLNPIEQAPAIYRFASSPLLMRSDSSLKRPQEINDVLLLPSSQPIETFDDLICLAAIALVISNDFHQVGRPSIMEEEDALSDAPERSGSELVGAGTTLRDSVGEAFCPCGGREGQSKDSPSDWKAQRSGWSRSRSRSLHPW